MLAGAELGPGHALVGQRAGRARDHALAARDARGAPHRQVEIEADVRRVAAAAAADDHVLLDVIAAAHAAVAEDARLVVDGDAQRRVVTAARRQAARIPRLVHARRPGHRLQLAVAGVLLPRARRRMVGHQHLDERAPRPHDAGGGRRDLHARFALADARRGVDARAHVHHADTAHANRRLVLLVAQRRDRDPVQPRRVEDRRALRDRDVAAVDREGDRLAHATAPIRKHTPAWQTPLACASTSSGKCFMTDAIGT